MRSVLKVGIAVSSLALTVACGDDDETTPETQNPTSSQSFAVTIENISGNSALPGPFAPGTFVAHTGSTPLFIAGSPDAGQGLEVLAEDGGGDMLAAAVGGEAFGIPVGESGPGPLFPGMNYEFTVTTSETDVGLSFATMLVQSNDLFVTNGVESIPLFDAQGQPLGERDVTALLEVWDAGTEVNQAPGFGPDQPLLSGGPAGAAEGVLHRFNYPTRALPNASQLVDVDVVDNGNDFTITITNTSDDANAPMLIAP
ncbi:MAG: spondin domain-containing protein, partial [Myxococcota bacterium]